MLWVKPYIIMKTFLGGKKIAMPFCSNIINIEKKKKHEAGHEIIEMTPATFYFEKLTFFIIIIIIIIIV